MLKNLNWKKKKKTITKKSPEGFILDADIWAIRQYHSLTAGMPNRKTEQDTHFFATLK